MIQPFLSLILAAVVAQGQSLSRLPYCSSPSRPTISSVVSLYDVAASSTLPFASQATNFCSSLIGTTTTITITPTITSTADVTVNTTVTVTSRITVDTTLTTLITPAPVKLKRDELEVVGREALDVQERQAATFTPVPFAPLNPSQRTSVCSCLIAQPTTTSTVTAAVFTTAVTTTVATTTTVTTINVTTTAFGPAVTSFAPAAYCANTTLIGTGIGASYAPACNASFVNYSSTSGFRGLFTATRTFTECLNVCDSAGFPLCRAFSFFLNTTTNNCFILNQFSVDKRGLTPLADNNVNSGIYGPANVVIPA